MRRLTTQAAWGVGCLVGLMIVAWLLTYGLLSRPPSTGIPFTATDGAVGEQQQEIFVLRVRELAAQEGVWSASNMMAIFAVVATIIGGFGLHFLRETVRQTQQASEYAQQTLSVARDEFRGALRLKTLTGKNDGAFSRGSMSLSARFLNEGKTKVTNCQFQYLIRNQSEGDLPITEFSEPITIETGDVFAGEDPRSKAFYRFDLPDSPDPFQLTIVIRLTFVDKYKRFECIDYSGRIGVHDGLSNKVSGSWSPADMVAATEFEVLNYGNYSSCLSPEELMREKNAERSSAATY